LAQYTSRQLLKAMDNIAHHRNLVSVDLDDLSGKKIIFEESAFKDFNEWATENKKLYQ